MLSRLLLKSPVYNNLYNVCSVRTFCVNRFVRQNVEAPSAETENAKQRVPTRITSNKLPFHTAQEVDSYPRVTFIYRNIDQGYSKVNDTCRMIRKLSCREAVEQLKLDSSKSGRILAKWLRSCMIQAENSKGMNTDRLLVQKAYVGRGTYLSRVRYHARGRFGMQRRKRTHVTVELVEVPMKEGERRLGTRGWKNETWDRYAQITARVREMADEIHREKGRPISAREVFEQYKKEGLHKRKPKEQETA
jgi:ribosomal protein L22